MKKATIKLSILTLFLIPFITGCDEKVPESEGNVIFVTEHITFPTTWMEGNVYIVDINGDFGIEALLTIEPNVIVKFLKENQRAVVSGAGAIMANGTSEQPIFFTSPKDDMYGGDNNDDGPTAPAPGDWGKIELREASSSVFSYCHFYYGGGLILQTVEVIHSVVDIDHCVFANNLGGKHASDYKGVVDLDQADPTSTLKNNLFVDNVLPITINANMSIDNSNMFYDPENPEIGNEMNGIFTNTQIIDDDVSWLETDVPFVLADENELRIESNGSLTLGDGCVVKIVVGTCINLVQNPEAGLINGEGSGVYFTSFYDDEILGDTDGASSSRLPMEGDWQGIRIALNPMTYAGWPNILFDEKHQ